MMRRRDIERLLAWALRHDDLELASTCELALDGDEDARHELARREGRGVEPLEDGEDDEEDAA